MRSARWMMALGCLLAACDASSGGETVAIGGQGGEAQGGGGAGAADGGGGTTGLGGSFGAGGFMATPVRDLPGLESITFWERTGGTAPTDYTFDVNGSELTARLDDPLATANQDITGTPVELYDVYYSDGDGVFDVDGSFLTISGVFPPPLPAGGGLNLAEIALNFSDASVEYGNYVASFVALGDNQDASLVGNCIDSDLQTHTVMGNTTGASERLRLTLGFESTSGPPQ